MGDLQIFSFDGCDLRVVMGEDGEPWFVAADVARALGYRDAANAVRSLKDHHRGTRSVSTPSGDQRMTVLSESGLYRLVMRSDVPKAEPFQEWVTGEVLPAIRKTGRYASPTAAESALPDFSTLDPKALVLINKLSGAAIEAQKRLAVAEPRAIAWTVLASTGRDYDVGTAAKILNRDPSISTGRNRLFAWMLEHGMTFKDNDGRRTLHKPYQKHVDAGRLVLRFGRTFVNPKTHGVEAGGPQLRITAKGIAYIHREMGGTAELDVSQSPEPPALPPGVQ